MQADEARRSREPPEQAVATAIKTNEEGEDQAYQSKEALVPKAAKHKHSNSSLELQAPHGLLDDGAVYGQIDGAADLKLKTALQSSGGQDSPNIYGNVQVIHGGEPWAADEAANVVLQRKYL